MANDNLFLQLKPREKAALNYSEALKEKFAGHPQVRRIARHRQVPKHIYNAQAELRTIRNKRKTKLVFFQYSIQKKKIISLIKLLITIFLFFRESKRRAHSRPGSVPFVSERETHVVQEKSD